MTRDFRELKVWEKSHLLLPARDLEYLDAANHARLTPDTTEVKRMLTSFVQKPEADR
jgi:hypothetical protein